MARACPGGWGSGLGEHGRDRVRVWGWVLSALKGVRTVVRGYGAWPMVAWGFGGNQTTLDPVHPHERARGV
eukprot:206047-Prymnesium_polylepis.1